MKDTREVRKAVRFQTAVAPDSFDVKQLRWVTVAPDGSRVVYSALGHLYVKDLPAGTPRRLTKADDRFELYPSLSRDGAARRLRHLERRQRWAACARSSCAPARRRC